MMNNRDDKVSPFTKLLNYKHVNWTTEEETRRSVHGQLFTRDTADMSSTSGHTDRQQVCPSAGVKWERKVVFSGEFSVKDQ